MSDKRPSILNLYKFDGQEWGMTGDESRNEMLHRSLTEQQKQTKLLTEIKESTALESYDEPREIVINPEIIDDRDIYVDTSGIVDDLLPELETIAKRQGIMIAELVAIGGGLIGIGAGVGSISSKVSQVSKELDSINESLNDGFDRIENAIHDNGERIDDLTHEVAKNTRVIINGNRAIIDTMRDSQALAYWMHAKEMEVRQQLLQTMQNPRRTAANEAWQIGEECRHQGNRRAAINMYAQSLQSNPADIRNYISLSQVFLEEGDIQKAKKYLARGVEFALGLDQQSLALLCLAKIEMSVNNHKQAKMLLELALKADIKNVEVWFELAMCELKLGNARSSLDYINNLLHLKPRIAAQYAKKLFAKDEFKPLWGEIRKIIHEIINNQ